MSDENQDQIVNDDQVDVNEAKQAVDLDTYERTKNDMHKFKRQQQELHEQNEKLQAQLRDLEEQKLKNTENYKELWEKERQQKSELENKYKSFSSQVLEDKKMNEIRTHALKSGLDNEFLDLLEAFDTSDVLVETTSSGQFIVNGADTWVESLKAAKPKLFSTKHDPSVNNSGGKFDGKEKTYTPKEILALQKNDPDKYRDIMTTKRHLIKN